MIGQIYHVGAVCVQKCSFLILHNQLAVRHDQRNTLCFQSENFALKKKERKSTTVMQDIILGDEMLLHCLCCRYIHMVVCIGKEYCMAVYCMEVMHGSFCMGRRLRNK